MDVRRTLMALVLVVSSASLATACENTADGILEDTRENVDAVDDQLETDGA